MTAHFDIVCIAVVVTCTLVDYLLIWFVLIYWFYQWSRGMNFIGSKVSIALGARAQEYRELDCVRGEGSNGIRDNI